VPNILAQLSAEKKWVRGWGAYFTHPSLPISKQGVVGIRVNFSYLEHFYVMNFVFRMLVIRELRNWGPLGTLLLRI
jgi:hypothetical protein